jgi:transcriptional regulator with XRE-family HTH domain
MATLHARKRGEKIDSRSATPADVQLGKRIRTARELAGLSHEALGEALGVPFQRVQKYEKGTNRVTAMKLQIISRELSVPMADLYGSPTNQPKRSAERIEMEEFMAAKYGIKLMRGFMRLSNERKLAVIALVDALDSEKG